MKSVIFKGALVLTLGVASGALAQTEILKKDPTQQTETQQTQSVTSSPKQGKHRGQSDTPPLKSRSLDIGMEPSQ